MKNGYKIQTAHARFYYIDLCVGVGVPHVEIGGQLQGEWLLHPPCGSWGLNSGPLEEQPILLITSCLPRHRNHQSLSPDSRASVKRYRASRPVPNAGEELGLDMAKDTCTHRHWNSKWLLVVIFTILILPSMIRSVFPFSKWFPQCLSYRFNVFIGEFFHLLGWVFLDGIREYYVEWGGPDP